MNELARHKRAYAFFRPLTALYAKSKLGYQKNLIDELPEPFLMLSNHVTDLDMMCVAGDVPNHMYFVGSEHIMRAGLASKFLTRYFEPIVREKGTVGVGTVLKMRRHIKAGHNICLFPEGNKSWSGKTLEIVPATAAMAKKLGSHLVTFRLHGGYFADPRWAKSARKGEMYGELVRVYSPEELAAMTDEEVAKHINEDLFVDAYADNAEKHVAYRGQDLAEHLEFVLVKCPHCGALNSIKSKGDEFFCGCGLKGKFDEYGLLSGEGFDFTTLTEWDEWQREEIANGKFTADENGVLASDEDQILNEITKEHETIVRARGTLSITAGALSVGEVSLPLTEIVNCDIILHGYMLFSTVDGRYFEIRNSERKFAAYLYLLLMQRNKACLAD